MAITVGCECGWTTDIELTSETNPYHCPKCGGEIRLAGGGELLDAPLYVDDELNPVLLEDENE